MADVWPTDDMLTAACLAAQPYEHATIGLAHAVAAATVAAAPTLDGWWFCHYWSGTPWQHPDDCHDCPGPHQRAVLLPEESADG